MCVLIFILRSLAFCPGAGHTVYLSFLLKSVRQQIGLTSPRALGALGLCAETFCWRKCSQNKGLMCAGKREKHLISGIIATFTPCTGFFTFLIHLWLRRGTLESLSIHPWEIFAGICWLFCLQLNIICVRRTLMLCLDLRDLLYNIVILYYYNYYII